MIKVIAVGYRIINGKFHPVGNFPDSTKGIKKDENIKSSVNNDFQSILKEIKNEDRFKISKHACERLKIRNISFNEEDIKNINEGINKAKLKGAKEALILYKDVALITSIKNRTIITAVDKTAEEDKIFTNIDSVVLL